MFRQFRAFLTRWRRRKQHEAARARRMAAYSRLRDAEARGDSRDIGRFRMDLMEATTEALRLGA